MSSSPLMLVNHLSERNSVSSNHGRMMLTLAILHLMPISSAFMWCWVLVNLPSGLGRNPQSPPL